MYDDDDVDLLEVGEIVAERYEVIGRVGSGASAQVFKVSDKTTRDDVAIKICHHNADLARFSREIGVMRSVVAKHVMPILGDGVHCGLPFLVMPLAQPCLTEVEFSQGDPQSTLEVLGIFLQICEGVCSLHAAGVVHRDIKPNNILQLGGVWVVADFGIIKDLSRNQTKLTKTGMRLGTEVYMAPEQWAGDINAIDRTTDVYPLGVVLYEMLTGVKNPLQADLSELPSDQAKVIQRCLKRKQDKRYSSVRELMGDIQSLVASYAENMAGLEVQEAGFPDPPSWLDSQYFANTCRKANRASYALVRSSDRWEQVIEAVPFFFGLLFERFDAAFVEGTIPGECDAGGGVLGLIKGIFDARLEQFSAVEMDVIKWLALRRVVLAAAVKYVFIARVDVDALLALFFNFVAPDERTEEFLRLSGWRQHAVRMRPFFTKLGIKPSELTRGPQSVSTLGAYEKEWLESFQTAQGQFPSWWRDGLGLPDE